MTIHRLHSNYSVWFSSVAICSVSHPTCIFLQGSVPFNVSRLFKWQETNSLASAMEETVGSKCTHEHIIATSNT